ncbi:MAG: hypothetical protein RLZZ165_262 [Bacteroidota bacterium]
MVRPAAFGYDPETASNNAFQNNPGDIAAEDLQSRALQEFDNVATEMRANGVNLYVVDDKPSPVRPDAIFPNNWISTHEDGTVILYPMMAQNRRLERRQDVLDDLEKYFEIRRVVDLSRHENTGRYLEGTGSMVFDRTNGVVYACRSPRTNETVLKEVAKTLNYRTVVFDAVDSSGKPIYHTNVMLSIGTNYVVLADYTIPDPVERERVMAYLGGGGHRIVKLRPEQLKEFAGNVLEISGRERFVAMSSRAYRSLSDSQLDLIELWAKVVHFPIPTIENVGGGSIRCMLGEIFLPRQ